LEKRNENNMNEGNKGVEEGVEEEEKVTKKRKREGPEDSTEPGIARTSQDIRAITAKSRSFTWSRVQGLVAKVLR
jgi:hypothetical protein